MRVQKPDERVNDLLGVVKMAFVAVKGPQALFELRLLHRPMPCCDFGAVCSLPTRDQRGRLQCSLLRTETTRAFVMCLVSSLMSGRRRRRSLLVAGVCLLKMYRIIPGA